MNQICCLNPECNHPSVPQHTKFCPICGIPLVILRNRYQPFKPLGGGGFAKTYLAVDIDKLNEKCVIKQFAPQTQGTTELQKATELFLQEAQQLQQFGECPQIPALLAYFSDNNRLYLVQQFIDGENLSTELEHQGIFNESKIWHLLQDLLPVVQAIHSQGIIHRDIKPENIIRRYSDNKLFLVDFGAVKVVKPQQRTATGTIIGSAEYCAPEQSMGKPLFISDLYSLGVTCLHLLTGISPFDLYSPLEGEWVWRDYLNGNVVSDKLGKILDKLAHPIPKHRYQSIPEVINEFNSVHQNINLVSCLPVPQLPVVSGYQKLEQFLEAGKWKEGDEETFRIMLAVTKREKEGWLNETSIDNFPCDDLHTIDDLWIKYSNGRFGFSVQKQIYQGLGGTRKYNDEIWAAFGDRVGWRTGNEWLYYEDLTFNTSAPQGHLPAIYPLKKNGKYRGDVRRGFSFLVSRLESNSEVINTIPSWYQKLKQFLEAGKWKEADEETFRIMLAVTQREKEGWLNETSIDNFPCDDLRTIDDLWIKYSNGRFGFSVQNQIYQGLGGTRKYNDEIWAAFGDKVGWRQGERRLWYKDVAFNILSPQGHLPARFWDDWDGKGVGGGSRSIGRVTSLLLRLVNCNI